MRRKLERGAASMTVLNSRVDSSSLALRRGYAKLRADDVLPADLTADLDVLVGSGGAVLPLESR